MFRKIFNHHLDNLISLGAVYTGHSWILPHLLKFGFVEECVKIVQTIPTKTFLDIQNVAGIVSDLIHYFYQAPKISGNSEQRLEFVKKFLKLMDLKKGDFGILTPRAWFQVKRICSWVAQPVGVSQELSQEFINSISDGFQVWFCMYTVTKKLFFLFVVVF